MRRFGRFLRNVGYLAAPYFRSEEKWSAWGLLAFVLAADFALVRINVLVNLNGGAWVNALQQYDEATFFHLLLSYEPSPEGPFGIIPGFAPLVGVALLVWVNGRYMRQWLQIRMRRWLTTYYQQKWLSDRAYYRMQLQPETLGNDNPDQRISEDIANFVESVLILGFGLLTNIVSLVSFLQILYMLSFPVSMFGLRVPAYLVWVALGYSVVGTLLAHLIGRPLVSLNFIRQRLEADFRFALVRLRENAEGVALYRGETDEGRILNSRFTAIVANFRHIMSRNRLVNAFTYSYGQVAGIIPFLAASPLYFAKQISFGTLSRVAGAFGEVQAAASWMVDNYIGLADWASTVERLATFGRSLDAMRAAGGGGIVQVPGTGNEFVARDLHLALPNRAVLLDHTDLTLAPGSSTVLSGRSGIGKSTLFRALAGIWPFGSGTVERPAGTTMFLPQKPYIPLGTLRRAVTYPAAMDAFSQQEVAAALADAGLGFLLPELDVDMAWGQRLSGGEQQRLALARALLTRPDWLFLDEATANLDPAGEAELYRLLHERLPGTTLLSIGHRAEVTALHERHLVLETGANGAVITPAQDVALAPGTMNEAAMVDLRSDTVTRPTPAMRAAMAAAVVGDDGYGDDPTVNALERKAAALLGKAAAVLVPTGTMGNLCAVFAQTGRGDEVIVESTAHIYRTEQGGMAALAGAPYRVLPGDRGAVPFERLAAEIEGSVYSTRLRPALLCLETTHNAAGGTVLPLDYLAAVRALAAEHGITVHIDGARVFNAATALGVPVAEIARHADTVTFCLSKGLGAPAGSVLCGPEAAIRRARQARKLLGGTMRQSGVLAAAGIVALDTMVDRLADDHRRARTLAQGLAALHPSLCDPGRVETNVVFVALAASGISAAEWCQSLGDRGVICRPYSATRLRLLTHADVSDGDVAAALSAFQAIWPAERVRAA